MSSTNRGAVRSPNDYYVTPVAEICKFLTAFYINTDFKFVGASVLDPCAGGDAMHPMSYPEAICIMCAGVKVIHTIDIREDSRARDKQDYLNSATPVPPTDVIISNPPFSLAQQFVTKALQEVKPGGYVIFLARLNFFGADCRRDWWREHMPTYAYVHSKRMSFKTPLSEALAKKLGKKPGKPGQTDSIEYAHLVWIQGQNPRWTQLRVI